MRDERGQHDAVAFDRWLFVDELREQFPILDPARLFAGPLLSFGSDVFGLRRVLAILVGIDAKLRAQCASLGHIGIETAHADPDVHRGAAERVVSFRIHIRSAGGRMRNLPPSRPRESRTRAGRSSPCSGKPSHTVWWRWR